MTLPPMPQLKDFPDDEYGYNDEAYLEALATWERTCKRIIESPLTAGPVAPPPELERVEQALRAATRELVATYGWENPRLQSLYDQITGVLGEAPRGAARPPVWNEPE